MNKPIKILMKTSTKMIISLSEIKQTKKKKNMKMKMIINNKINSIIIKND